jgi:signal transduction histidine kinase
LETIKPRTLKTTVWKKIGIRIILAMLLISTVFLISTAYDVVTNLNFVHEELSQYVNNELDNYIAAKSLVGDTKAINIKLKNDTKQKGMQITWSKKDKNKHKGMHYIFPFKWSFTHKITRFGGNTFGAITINGNLLRTPSFRNEFFVRLLILILFMGIIFFLLVPVIINAPTKLIINPIHEMLKTIINKEPPDCNAKENIIEISELKNKILNLISQVEKNAADIAMTKIVKQVVHDIKAPILIMLTVINRVDRPSQQEIVVLKQATSRLSHILNDLVKNIHVKGQERAEMMAPILADIVLEKKMLLRDKKVRIDFDIDMGAMYLFCLISSNELKRVLSNILNNAYEAVSENGRIKVSLKKNANFADIRIKDNGFGIKKEDLNSVFHEGISYNKKNATGLGLWHAKETIMRYRGKINLLSEENSGTEVKILIPLCANPGLIIPSLDIYKLKTVVIVDDDEFIHELWNNKLKSYENLHSVHFFNLKQFKNFVESSQPFHDLVFLVDQEYSSKGDNGLDFIIRQGLCKQSILVTNKYDDTCVREGCIRNRIPLLPKNLVEKFDMAEGINFQKANIVILDDDELVRKVWQLSAKKRNIKLKSYASSGALLGDFVLKKSDLETVFYIDKNLYNDQYSGIQVAEQLFKSGFKKIYLITGEPMFAKEDYILDYLDKTPPFD